MADPLNPRLDDQAFLAHLREQYPQLTPEEIVEKLIEAGGPDLPALALEQTRAIGEIDERE